MSDPEDARQSARIRVLHDDLRERVMALQLITESLPVVMWATDTELRCMSVTGSGLRALGFNASEVIGRKVHEILGFHDPNAPIFAAHSSALNGTSAPFEIAFKGRHLQVHVSPQRAADGKVTGCVGIALDITARIDAEKAALRREKQLDDLFENTPVGLHQLDSDARILRANRAELRVLGYSANEYIGRYITDFFVDLKLAADVKDRLRKHQDLNELETSLRCRDSRIKYIQMSCNWFMENGVPLYSRGYMRDITEIKSSWAQLHYRATHDPLTGALNRASFMEMLNHAAKANPHAAIAVLFIDVDNLKKINDKHGHATGDEVLIEVTRAMQSCMRPGDIVARLAGDEFCVLVFDVHNEADARAIGLRIQRELGISNKLSAKGIVPSLSIGISLRMGADTPERLLNEADQAMYASKAAGKSSIRIAVRTDAVPVPNV